MKKTYLATKDETIRTYKSLAEVSPACTETTSAIEIFYAMMIPSRLMCNITNSSVYPGFSGTLTINRTGNETGTAMFVDVEGRVSTAVFPWSDWQSPGYNNPNLLLNWDFRRPVNQRGQSSYTNSGYAIDMWFTNRSSTYEIEAVIHDDYISLKPIEGNLWFCQNFEAPLCDDKVYTASVAYKNGEIRSVQLKTNHNYKPIDTDLQVNIGTKTMFELVALSGYPADIQAVKLEVGTVSTLALDLKQPSNYGEELRKCQRYFYRDMWTRLKASTGANRVALYTVIDLPQNMRINPSIKIDGADGKIVGSGSIVQLQDVLNDIIIDGRITNGQKGLALNFYLNTPLAGYEIYSIEDIAMIFSAEL